MISDGRINSVNICNYSSISALIVKKTTTAGGENDDNDKDDDVDVGNMLLATTFHSPSGYIKPVSVSVCRCRPKYFYCNLLFRIYLECTTASFLFQQLFVFIPL